MKQLSAKLIFIAVLFTLLTIGAPFLFTQNARAADFWRGVRNIGYFNCFFGYNAFHEQSIAGHGKVIPSSIWKDGVGGRTYNNSDEFVARLKVLYSTGGQNATGVAFLVKSMLGYGFCPGGNRGPSTDRNISAAQWNDFQARLKGQDQSGNINWNYRNYYSPTTSLGSNKFVGRWGGAPSYTYYAGYDVASVTYRQVDDAIVINSPSGQIIIFYTCGNPPADKLGPLPSENYNLNPNISVNPKSAEAETSVTLQPINVNNTGTTPSPSSTRYSVSAFTIEPDPNGNQAAVPSGGVSLSDPVAYYGHGAKVVSSGQWSFPRGVYPVTIGPQKLPDLPVGYRVCYALSVTPYRQSTAGWRHSTPDCVTISKKPKVQVIGGDLIVGRGVGPNLTRVSNIDTSVSSKANKLYGSWVEYGMMPTGTVSGMASGAAYVTAPSTPLNLCMLSQLTFTTGSTSGSGCGSSIGGYTQATLAPNVSARFPIHVPAASATPANPANPKVVPSTTLNLTSGLSGAYQAPANGSTLTISGGTIPKKRWIVINAPDKTIRITGDITYTSEPLNGLSDIPQVILIGKNILIADSVTRVDAWLVAVGAGTDGIVNTCGYGGVGQDTPLTYLRCDEKLTVNGPVIANHLLMRRTAGSGTGANTGDPAEVFNLRPDAYIWAANYTLNTGRLPTVVNKELPPRF